MSRYCGERNPDAVLKAAEHWKSVALLGAGSVLTAKSLWTRDNFEAIDQYYVMRPDEGDGRFHEKLQEQLTPTAPPVKQLVAEMLWLMYLCPSSINASRKRNVIARVWSWSGEALPEDVPTESSLAEANPEVLSEGAVAKLPKSHEKVVRMLRSLRLNQFASFTE